MRCCNVVFDLVYVWRKDCRSLACIECSFVKGYMRFLFPWVAGSAFP